MSLFGYFQLGLQSMNAARLGLQIAGDNIANAQTPGYARRRIELGSGHPVRVPGGLLGQGVDVQGFRRMEDLFLGASLQREQGNQARSDELVRGLRQAEAIFGNLESEGTIAGALSGFSASFDQLAAQPENQGLRRGAVASAEALATAIRDTYGRLSEQRSLNDQRVSATVDRVNVLAQELASLNREIATEEGSGGVAAPFRDRRGVVLDELAQLTGGVAAAGPGGRVSFSFAGGPTLVTGEDAIPLTRSRAADGTVRVHNGADGKEITNGIRGGRLGSLLYLRDQAIPDRMDDLDTLATDVITRANALSTGAFDLQGNPGNALFVPDPPGASGAARGIAVSQAIVQDVSLLAVSSTGAPGEGDIALEFATLSGQASAGLGGQSASGFLAGMLAGLGNEVVQADVAYGVAQSLVEGLTARRDAVSGVSLDEEAVELIRNQRSFEAAAKFIQVLNTVTEIAVGLVQR